MENMRRDGSSVRALVARGQALHEALRAWGGPGSARLQKLVRAELSFLNRLAALPLLPSSCPALHSTNFDHLEGVFRILQHPLVNGVSAVMQNLAVGGAETSSSGVAGHTRLAATSLASTSKTEGAHVDIVCMLDGKPVWLIVSSRNPRYVRWLDTTNHEKGLRSRLLLLLDATCADALKQPQSIFLCFAGEVPEDVDRGLKDEFKGLLLPKSPSSSCSHEHSSPSNASGQSNIFDRHQEHGHFSSSQQFTFCEVEEGEWLDLEVKDAPRWNEGWETYQIDVGCLEHGRRVKEEVSAQLQTEIGVGVHTEKRGIEEISAELQKDLHIDEVRGTVERKEGCSRESDTGVCSSSSSLSREKSGKEISFQRENHSSPDLDLPAEKDDQKSSVSQNDAKGLVNLDTTALVALVSELSNGGASCILALPQEDLEKRFPSMSAFIHEQALSEVERPLVPEIEEAMAFRDPVVSQYVYDEFSSIVSQIGGVKEKDRAKKLLQRVRVVPDTPSNRVMALPLSGRIKRRHKIVFGTGDFLNAPTLTANMSFVRAARDKGMPLDTLEHRPRALTGE